MTNSSKQTIGFIELHNQYSDLKNHYDTPLVGRRDIVDAAHLRPLDKLDKRTTATTSRLWNPTVREPPKQRVEHTPPTTD